MGEWPHLRLKSAPEERSPDFLSSQTEQLSRLVDEKRRKGRKKSMNLVFICAFTFTKSVTAEVPASVKMVPLDVVIILRPVRTHSREVVCDLALAPAIVTGNHHSRDTSHRSSTVAESTLFFQKLRSSTTSVFCSQHLTVLTNSGFFRGALCPRQGCGVQVALAPLTVK